MGQSLAIPRVIPNDWKRLDLIINKIKMRLGRDGSPTFANTYVTNTITAATSVFSKTCTVAAGLNVLRVTSLQTDATALTGTLRGGYIDVSNGALDATGTIRALELKARTEAPGDTGNDVAVLEGLSISADSKGHGVTTMRAAEFILDGSLGGTITEAVGLRIANNLQADKADFSYGLQIYRDSFDYTADIQLSSGGLIGGSAGALQITPGGTANFIGNVLVDGAFYLKDLLTEYYLHLLVAETNLTADRFLVIDVNDADRRIDITGDSTINQDVSTVGSPTFVNLNLTGYIDQSDIADPGAPAASKSRLFSNSGHTISLSPDDTWHDLSMGGKGTSSCVHDAITITHVGGSGLNITWSAGTIFDAAITGESQMVTIAAQPVNQACTASSANFLFFDRSGGILVLNTSGPDYSDGDFSIAHILTTHDDIFEIFYRPIDKEIVHNIKWGLREAFENVVVSGLVVSAHAGDGVWDVDQSAGSFVHGGFSLKTASLIDSTVGGTHIIRWYHNAANAWETDTDTQIDNLNWDDDDDDLTVKGTAAGKYYRSVFVTCGDRIHWVYPQVQYANIAAALAGPDPTLPPALEHLPKTTVLILKHGAAGLPAVGSDQWIDARPILGVVSTGASIADHGSLTGLGDDDHTQYPLLLGRTGGQTLAGSDTTAEDLTLKDNTVDNNTITITQAISAYTHSGLEAGNPHIVTPTELGLVIGTNVQAWDAQLDDIAVLAVTDSNFIVGNGANWVAESGATARTSLGLGTGDSPQFTSIELGHADDTTITRVSAGVIAVEGVTVMMVGGAPTAHLHDGDTLEHDGVNSSAGAFSFTTAGTVTFSNSITMSEGTNLTVPGHIIFTIDDSSMGFATAKLTLNGTGGTAEITGALIGLSTAAFEGASVTVGKASTTTGTIVLHDSGSANTITLTVPDSLAASLSFTLPPTDGDNTNVLQTNGSGVLTWAVSEGTSHADVVVDGDFASNGILNRTGAGAYSILALGTDVQAYHANLAAIAGGTWTGAASITTLGTIGTGTWGATDVAILHGGTGASTAQAAIDALSAVGAATNEHVLTKDTGTGNAIWKVAAGGAGNYVVCDINDTPTNVYTKYFTGTLDEDTSTSVAHGIGDKDKILHVSAGAYDDVSAVYRSADCLGPDVAGKTFAVQWDDTNVTLTSVDTHIEGNNYRFRIDYIL